MKSSKIQNLKQGTDLNIVATVFLFVCFTLLGIWIRINGLGERPIALDEYYFVRSVQNILEFGTPRYPDGGYYVRGIFLQYLTAFSIFLFGDGPFAYRLVPALFGIGTLVMVYFLGRQFLDRLCSLVLVLIITFSSWEIEFSRFARMYSGFQFVSVCFFWSLYRYSFNGDSNKKYIPAVFAMLAILTHQMGIFIALLLFLPFPAWVRRSWGQTLWNQRLYIVISSLLLCIGFLNHKINFRLIGTTDSSPRDFISSLAQSPQWFEFGTEIFGEVGFFLMAILASTAIISGYFFHILKKSEHLEIEEILLGGLLALALCSAIFYQFAMSTVILLVIALRKPYLFRNKPYNYFLSFFAILVVFWFIILFFNQTGIETTGVVSSIKTYLISIRLTYFSFPDLYSPVFRAWAGAMPLMGFFLALAMAWQVFSIRRLSLASIVKHPITPILVIVFIMGLKPPLYTVTRYSHFLYPLALCIGLLSAAQIGEILRDRFIRNEKVSKFYAIFLTLLAFTVSEDFNAYHITHLQSDEIVFRMGKYEKFSQHWYPRLDFQKPAELVDMGYSQQSKIIVSSYVNTIGAYLKSDFAFYWPQSDARFNLISRAGGTRELWSGARLLSHAEDLIEYTKDADIIWLVSLKDERDPLRIFPEMLWPNYVKSVDVFAPGRDKRIEVWKISLK